MSENERNLLEHNTFLKNDIVKLQAEIAKLKKAYKKYAWHKKDCMLFSIAEHPHCTCGFEQALKGESDAI